MAPLAGLLMANGWMTWQTASIVVFVVGLFAPITAWLLARRELGSGGDSDATADTAVADRPPPPKPEPVRETVDPRDCSVGLRQDMPASKLCIPPER